jgi:hypothetical protein
MGPARGRRRQHRESSSPASRVRTSRSDGRQATS